jgi:hypothetical protein
MPEIEYMLLADHAEAVNGKLNVMGAGWTDQWRAPRPPEAQIPITHFGIGVSVLVPWTETNRRHHLVLRIQDEDGRTEVGNVEADLEIGRPVGLPDGSDQRAVLAINADIQFPSGGGWRVIAQLAEQTKTVSFRIHDELPPGGAPGT